MPAKEKVAYSRHAPNPIIVCMAGCHFSPPRIVSPSPLAQSPTTASKPQPISMPSVIHCRSIEYLHIVIQSASMNRMPSSEVQCLRNKASITIHSLLIGDGHYSSIIEAANANQSTIFSWYRELIGQ